MSEEEREKIIEKLPDIFQSNNQNMSKQSIARRNAVIDEYLKSLEQKGNKKSELSNSSGEDDKDPFSSKAVKNLKRIKKSENKLILPNCLNREKLKNEFGIRNNTSVPKNKTSDEGIPKKRKKISKNKNLSDNNIIQKNPERNNIYIGKIMNINHKNNKLNSIWDISSSTYNNYINFTKIIKDYDLLKMKKTNNFKINNINKCINNNTQIQFNSRSKYHIKQSYNLYKDKLNSILNNKIKNTQNNYVNNIKGKYASTQEGIIPYNNSGVNNLYNNIFKKETNKKRNYTAKMIKNNISIKENVKQNKKTHNYRISSTLNNRHQIYEKLIHEKNNPYGLHWINKMLKKNTIEKVGLSKEFINGVPVIKLMGKDCLSKREMKKRLNEIEKRKKMEENKYNKIINAEAKLNVRDLDAEYNIPNEIIEQFNKNTKHFFQNRKDIIEQPDEEDQVLES